MLPLEERKDETSVIMKNKCMEKKKYMERKRRKKKTEFSW